MRLSAFARIAAILLFVGLTACGSGQRNVTLDASPEDVAKVRTIAIASITAHPSETREFLPMAQGHLTRVLDKFENELFEYMLMRGFNVVNPAVSRVAFTRETDYEDLYIANSPELLTNIQSPAEFKFIANNMKKLAYVPTLKPAGTFTSEKWEPAQDNLVPALNRSSTANPYMADIVSSANTRIFPQLEFGANLSSPTMTVLGGADDNRWASTAMRRAVGEITRRIGADAALFIDGHLKVSPRIEGSLIAGAIGGGNRFMVFEGTATLIRNDGAILSVESFHAISQDTLSGNEALDARSRTFNGLARFEGNSANVNDLIMQAVRRAADMIAGTYQDYATKYGVVTDSGDGSFMDRMTNW